MNIFCASNSFSNVSFDAEKQFGGYTCKAQKQDDHATSHDTGNTRAHVLRLRLMLKYLWFPFTYIIISTESFENVFFFIIVLLFKFSFIHME